FALLVAGGSYRARLHRSLLEEARSLLVPVVAPLAIFAIVLSESAALATITRLVPATVVLVILFRAGADAAVGALRRRGQLMEPTIIVGAGQVAVRIAETLLAHPDRGMAPVGFVDGFGGQGLPLPLLANIDGLDRVLHDFEVRRVIIAFGAYREPDLVDLLRSCRRAGVEVLVVPRLFELGAVPRCTNTEDLCGIPLIRVRPSDLRSVRYAVERQARQDSPRLEPLHVLGDQPHGDATWAPNGTVSLVIPAKNEARNIGWVLQRVPTFVTEVILVDGASTDDTVAVAKSEYPNIRVVQQERPGKGAALRAGFAAARGDFIVMLDADGSMDPTELGRYLDPLDHGYQFVKGSRYIAGGGSEDLTPLRRAGNFGLMSCVNALFSSRFSDLCYGFSAFRRDCLPALALQSDGFEIETEMCLRAVKADLRIAEVPSLELCRRFGESNLRTFRDGQRVLRKLLWERLDTARRPIAPLATVDAGEL
ncbi:MAG TPA: glycosyltransferase, partial [Acidimicrobiales bacterium]|nr:glycosyltransferase [Acidimicrobiales bacterium]